MAELRARLDAVTIKKLDEIQKLRREALRVKREQLKGVCNLTPEAQQRIFKAIRTKPVSELSRIIEQEKGESLLLVPVALNRGELISKIIEFVISTENTSPLVSWLIDNDIRQAQGKKRLAPKQKGSTCQR